MGSEHRELRRPDQADRTVGSLMVATAIVLLACGAPASPARRLDAAATAGGAAPSPAPSPIPAPATAPAPTAAPKQVPTTPSAAAGSSAQVADPTPTAGAAAAAGSGGTSGTTAAAAVQLPSVTSVDMAGPFQTTQNMAGGPRGQSGLFYPSTLGEGGLEHPIFLWGCGGGAQPATYAAQLTRIASHGFVVVAEVSMIGDDGDVLRASLDWIIAENARADGPFFETLDVARIAAGGHSIGSVNAFMMADDPRLTTSVHVAGGSLDDVRDISAPTTGMGGERLTHPAAFICSESDVFGNVEKTERDYEKTRVPVFFTVMSGVDHVAAASEGLSAIVAWLRWQLGGEEQRRPMFLDPMGEFNTGKYVSRAKNW
jgi:hypothetical protein